MSFIITVDSGCNISSDYAKEHDIRIIPFSYSCDGNIYYDNPLNTCSDTVDFHSHAPEISEYVDFWRRILSEGRPVLHISTGNNFSQAFSNALTAREILVSQNNGIELFIVDSCSVSCGCTLLLYKAVDMRLRETTAAYCAAVLESTKHQIRGVLISSNAVSMYKTGFLSFSSMLRALITGEETVFPITSAVSEVYITRCADDLIPNQLVRCISTNSFPVCIACFSSVDRAEKLAHVLSVKHDLKNIEIFRMNPSQSAALGTDTIALFFQGKLTEEFLPLSHGKRCPCTKFVPKPAYL